jgi:DNA-binding transcriptional ArsR family regulator
MARKYDDKVREAIWALLCEHRGDISAPLIKAQLEADAKALALPGEIPLRTVQHHVKALKDDRGMPAPLIEEGKEGQAVDAVARRLIELADRWTTRLEIAERTGDVPDAKTLALMRESTRSVVALKGALSPTKGSQQARAGKTRAEQRKPSAWMDKLARAAKQIDGGEAVDNADLGPAQDAPNRKGEAGPASPDPSEREGSKDRIGHTLSEDETSEEEVSGNSISLDHARSLPGSLAERVAALVPDT